MIEGFVFCEQAAGRFPMYQFHVNLFGQPAFSCTWESAAAALEGLPRMIFEADGSWIWSGDDPAGQRWQVDGHLFDFDDRLHRVELNGCCPADQFDQLLGCLGWPAVRLSLELVREGKCLDEAQFRRHMQFYE